MIKRDEFLTKKKKEFCTKNITRVHFSTKKELTFNQKVFGFSYWVLLIHFAFKQKNGKTGSFSKTGKTGIFEKSGKYRNRGKRVKCL